jgi:hypothetical protein
MTQEVVSFIQAKRSDFNLDAFLTLHPIDKSGCQAATDFLGSQSKCTECPFGKCIDDITTTEKKVLKGFWKTGILPEEYLYLRNLAIYITKHNYNRDKVKV